MIDSSMAIQAAIQGLAATFAEDELAYLALTSKVELPLRDRLAFSLHKRFESISEVAVAREWRRFDLAILSNGKPSTIIEAKAMYSFDMFTNHALWQYPNKVDADISKFLRFFGTATEQQQPVLYSLLLATHPHVLPPRELDGIIKYNSEIQRYSPLVTNALLGRVREYFGNHPQCANGVLYGGVAFGVPVSVYYWLFGPYLPRHCPGPINKSL